MVGRSNVVRVYEILNLTRGLYKMIEEDWEKASRVFNLTHSQQHVLWLLHFQDGCTLTELSNYGVWHLSTLMDIVNRMEKKGLVRREVDQEDKRITRVFTTEKGEEIRKKTMEIDYAKYYRIGPSLTLLSNEEVEQMISSLYQVCEKLLGDNFIHFIKCGKQILEEEY